MQHEKTYDEVEKSMFSTFVVATTRICMIRFYSQAEIMKDDFSILRQYGECLRYIHELVTEFYEVKGKPRGWCGCIPEMLQMSVLGSVAASVAAVLAASHGLGVTVLHENEAPKPSPTDHIKGDPYGFNSRN